MAVYHFTVKVHSRSGGRNAVSGAAYRHGQNMIDSQTGQVFTNATHQDVENCELSVPENAPKWARDLLQGDVHKNSEKLWNAVEQFEKRVDAQLYREVEFALPHELTKEQRLELAKEFILENFTSKGMIADWCVHNHLDDVDGIEKPHVHVMLTMREMKETTPLEKIKGSLGFSSSPINFGNKVRDWNSKILLFEWREKWAEIANDHLAKAGFDVRMDHRSYKEQGIDLIPQPKLGKSVHEMSQRGHYVDRFEEMRAVQAKNQALIKENPEIVIDYITRYQSTFTRQDVAKVLNRYIDKPEEFQMILGQIEASAQLVVLNGNEKGEALKLTTKDMIRMEKQLVTMGSDLSLNSSCPPHLSSIELALEKGHERLKEHGGLSEDQVHAIQHMVSSGQLKMVVGYAGAGKTTCLEVAKEIWDSSGYRIVGAAPTGKAASNLDRSGIPSKTLHKWEQEWSNDREQLNSRSVLVLDEAGMVDSQRLHSLLRESKVQGFKIVLVGDPEQLSPIEAGAPTRAVMETVGFAKLSTIVRQKADWQKEASRNLAIGQTEKALETYHQNGAIHYHESAKEQLIQDWACQLTQSQSTSLILTYTNQDVNELNTLARLEARKSGILEGSDYQFTVSKALNLETLDKNDDYDASFKPKVVREERSFAVGDQIVFLRNDYGLGVRNGQLGKITDIQEGIISVENDKKETLSFDIGTYNYLDYGYATTIHKSQGATVDNTFVFANSLMNKHLTYVALTRHKEDMQLYVDTNMIPTKAHLFEVLAKEAPKENALDYLHDPNQLLDVHADDQRAFMQRRSLSGSAFSYISWESIKEFTYKAWSQTKDWMFLEKAKDPLEQSVFERETTIDSKPYDLSLTQNLEKTRENEHQKGFIAEPHTPEITSKQLEQDLEVLEKNGVGISIPKSPYSYLEERRESILTYLKEEVCLEKHAWLKESSLDFFLKDADKDPLKALRRWQDVTGDKSFTPMSQEEAQLKSHQAQELLQTVHSYLPPKEFEDFSQNLPSNATGVILRCEKAIQDHQETQRNQDAEKFIFLSQKYQDHVFGDVELSSAEKGSLRKSISDISSLYQKDEAFLKKIESIRDNEVKDFALEVFRNKDLQKELVLERELQLSL